MNWWLHSGQKFIGSFDLPWSWWSGTSNPSKSLSSQRSTHPKWHRFLSKQFIGQTPLHHIHKFSFHWNLVIHKQPDTVRNPISYKLYLPQASSRISGNVWGKHQGCSCRAVIPTSVEEQSVRELTEDACWVSNEESPISVASPCMTDCVLHNLLSVCSHKSSLSAAQRAVKFL